MESNMNGRNFLFACMIMIIMLAAGCKPAVESSPLSAALSELSGTVDTKQAGDSAFLPASANTVLEVNGQVQTGDDGRVRLDLSSGTIIRVAPSSLFTLISNDEVEGGLATKLKLDIGKLFIILNGGSADVETPSGVASVRGSYMKVEVDPETLDIYITCLEGDCSASNPAGAVNFTNGQKVVLFHRDPVTGNWSVPFVEPMTPEEFQEWLDNNPEAADLFNEAMATMTAFVEPTETSTPTSTPQPTPTLQQVLPPGDSSSACFRIIQPEEGANLPQIGQVTFEWEEQSGAQKYLVTFIDEFGRRATIQTTETSTTNFIEIFPNGGQYNWFVTAYSADGSEICSTAESTFSKPQGDPTSTPTRIPNPDPDPTSTLPPPPTEDSCTIEEKCDPYNEECFVGYESDEWYEFCYGEFAPQP